MSRIYADGFGVVGQLKSELMDCINYLPSDDETDILQRILYYANECSRVAKEERDMIDTIAKNKENLCHFDKMYQELALLYQTVDFKKMREVHKMAEAMGMEIAPFTAELKDKVRDTLNLVTVEINNGSMLLVDCCSSVKDDRFVVTEESCFYAVSDDSYLLTTYITLKKIHSSDKFETENLVRKTVTYDGRTLQESRVEYLAGRDENSTGAILENKALIKVLSASK